MAQFSSPLVDVEENQARKWEGMGKGKGRKGKRNENWEEKGTKFYWEECQLGKRDEEKRKGNGKREEKKG